MSRNFGEIIELVATDPSGDLACDASIATAEACEGLSQDLRGHLLPPVLDIDNGVQVRFAAEGWDAVRRYVELESQCCSFLTHAEQMADGVLLTVSGGPEAKPWIQQIFA